MDAKEFLASVVPWDIEGGYVTIHWRRPGNNKWPGRSCRTLEDALAVVDEILKSAADADIFFCLSSQSDSTGKRSRANALGVSALWVDIDVKPDKPECYSTLEEALKQLYYFCALLEIPDPSVVIKSGGGIHAYWYSDHTLMVDEWQPYADALKAAAKNSSLKLDARVTSDISRILRVPGTVNYKYDPPRPVEFIERACTGTRYDFATAFAGILGMAPAGHTATILPFPVASAFAGLDPSIGLGQGINAREIPPLPFAPIKKECGWLREAHDTGGENFDNEQWNLTNLISTFLENGRDYAHQFGNKHPTYDLEKTDEQYDRKVRERRENPAIGWPRCATIKDSGSTHCATCIHLIKAKSPLNIGYEAIGPDIDNEEMRQLGGTRPADMRLPEGFCLDEKGRVCAFLPTRVVGKKVQHGRLVLCLLTQIKNPSFQYKEGHYGLGFASTTELSANWTEVFLSSSNCRLPKLIPYLAEKFVQVDTSPEATKMTEKFMVSWLDKLRQEGTAARDQGTMGWRFEDSNRIGFVYGGKLYHESGQELPLVAAADDDFRSWYMPQGNIEVWKQSAKLLTDRKRPELDIIISIAFAAPLATFAGTLYGAMLSVWGEPGTSKSTAQQVAAAVWGHPKQTRESLNSTPKSVQRRLGLCRNLPAYWDDVQDERHQLALFDCMFVTAEGAEGGRLNPDASYKARLEWQTLMVACSNASFVEYLIKKQKSTTAGMRRVFEVEYNKGDPEPGMVNAVDASRTFAQLEHNFGNIGVEYARMLAQEHREINVMVGETINRFSQKVQGTGDESYWWGICGVLIAGATLANRLGADLDVLAMEEFLIQTFLNNRKIRSTEGTEGGSFENTETALTSFLNFYVGNGNRITVDRAFENRHIKVTSLRDPNMGRPIFVQISRDERKIWVSKKAMREYLNTNEVQPRQVFNGLEKFFHAKEVRLTMGAGTVFSQTQELCLEIFVPVGQFEPLQQILVANGPSK